MYIEIFADFWWGVGNFKLHFLSHFLFNFENLSGHFTSFILRVWRWLTQSRQVTEYDSQVRCRRRCFLFFDNFYFG